jgi:hypothetical protein
LIDSEHELKSKNKKLKQRREEDFYLGREDAWTRRQEVGDGRREAWTGRHSELLAAIVELQRRRGEGVR